MVRITADLIRRKSEHNEGTMADLEEIALHQLEIERIENIGTLCRRLRILYLQNNIIGKMENLQHLKELEYLNLALNNITVIEGLESCEFLRKLDLTVNFIPCSRLEESVRNLQHNKQLRELYVVGNPFSDWEGHKDYLTAKVPWLEKIDGTSISKSDRIRAAQRLAALEAELAARIAEELATKAAASCTITEVGEEDEESAPYTPELRTEMYREMAEEKAEKEAREKERMPRERNYDKEHEQAVEAARAKQFFPDGRIRQCNEGGLPFSFDEDRENFYLRVQLPRHVDTSLVDCQVFPRFVQVVFRDKTLRVAMPGGGDGEVRADQSKCERSKTTGELKVSMPKLEPGEVLILGGAAAASGENDRNEKNTAGRGGSSSAEGCAKKGAGAGKAPSTRAERMLQEAVDIKRIYTGKENPNLEPATIAARAPAAAKAQEQLEAQLNVPALEDSSDEDE